ncbi:gamma-glutamyltransferase [Nesterenkonia natronophila]|uniref:Gamma-glutamyltranspeptidase n=1 Tax=Nesterenkonia natronophila TaxID=2174932 RepID=A0A3A4F9Z3_9MICC|nr:gamma-glutamyltransferase [Nesterenkonia natronophila]RJN31977.1 gamma-glutamyltranspeptidase [Nesterenkonia natronophila]
MSSHHSQGAVATSHYLATEAGADALRAGGNAIDAAISAAAALCVLYPNNVALGGDMVAVVRSPSGKVQFVNATGPAAADQSLESLRTKHGKKMPERGLDTITLPGGVRGWQKLSDLGGVLTWAQRLEAARNFAAAGAPVASSVAKALQTNKELLSSDNGARGVFFSDGEPLARGETLVQPALAGSFDALIARGPEDFYVGELSRRWREGLQHLGRRISAQEAAEYAPTVESPMTADVMGLRIYTGGPNTQGFSLLRTMQKLAQEGVKAPLGADANRLAGFFDEGNRIRDAHLADPRSMSITGEELLTVSAPDWAPILPPATGDTVGLSAVSSDGWAISLVQSLFKGFGSGILEPETGILFQNRGASYSLDPAHPAAIKPGMRPPHTLMPVVVEEAGRLKYVNATMGGQAQPQIHAQLLLQLLAGRSPQEATSSPRWITGVKTESDPVTPLIMEADLDEEARSVLDTSDYGVTRVPPRDEKLGHSNVIEISADSAEHTVYRASSDPRSDGSAVIVR